MDTHDHNDMGERRMGVRDDDQGAPMVGVPCEVYSRIVGYFRPIRNWNQGKRQEWAERKAYEVPDGD